MPRSRPPLRLRRNPLIIVLAQARFASVLNIAERLPAVQGRLRELGFPRFATAQTQNVVIPSLGGPQSSQWAATYHFISRDQTQSVILSAEFVTFEVTSYTSFEDFLRLWRPVLEIVEGEVKPALIERLGLRYVDLIQPRQGEAIEDWLQPGLHGLANLNLENIQSKYELRGKAPSGDFAFKAQRPAAGFVPEDLQPFALQVEPPEPLRQGEYVVLDFDHFTTEALDFDVQLIEDAFWSLHDFVDVAFRETVTAQAFDAWGSE